MKWLLGSAHALLLMVVVCGTVCGCGDAAQQLPPSWQESQPPPEQRSPGGEDGGFSPVDAGVPEPRDAGVVSSSPPEIMESWQSVSSVRGEGTVTLRVQAQPPREGTLTFSWQSLTGSFDVPTTTAIASEIVWTAPACGVGLSTHAVQVSLRHSSGLSSSKPFEISVECPRWNSAGGMVMARHDHTASLLPSGKVLVVGRYTGDRYNSAEEFNPANRSWALVADMERARRGHTASVLASGKVLVAGGYNNLEGIIKNTELYDPAASSSRPWTQAGDMNAIRTAHTATLLPSGKVLVVGGFGEGGALKTAELFDPASNRWSLTGEMAQGRYGHTATLLPSGKVLVVGGYGARGELAEAELYDPGLDAWTSAGSLVPARAYHAAVLLRSGQVLVAGGGTRDAALYNPSSNSWSPVESMSKARLHHTATLLPSGKVLVAGGMDAISLSSAEVYDPDSKRWSSTAPLATARSHHAALLLPSGQVLVAGGHAGSGPLNSAELYVP